MHANLQDDRLKASQAVKTCTEHISYIKQDECLSSIMIIGKSKIIRDALSYSLRTQADDLNIETAASLRHRSASMPDLVIIDTSGFEADLSYIQETIDLAAHYFGPRPLLLIVDPSDDGRLLHLAQEKGLAGCVPSTLGVNVVLAAVRLALIGGKFSLKRYSDQHGRDDRKETVDAPEEAMGNDYPNIALTPKEREIVHHLKSGKQNKVIAHEMSIAESTVKVHIRNIMKKLQARNRTQIAVLMHSEAPHFLKAS